MARLHPYGYVTSFGSPGMMVALAAGRSLVWEETPRGRRPDGSFAATVWVSRHWTTEQALATTLERSDYGNEFTGLHAAAMGYLGVEASALDAESLARLVAAIEYPTSRDPWCHPVDNAQAARHLLQRATIESELLLPDALPAPPGACS